MNVLKWEIRYWTVTGSFALVALALTLPQFLAAAVMLIWTPWSEVRRNPPGGRLVSRMGHAYDVWLRDILGPRPPGQPWASAASRARSSSTGFP